jgi:hypothetical protein
MICLKVKRVLLPLDIYICGYYEHTEVDGYGKGTGSGRSHAAALPLQPYMEIQI